MEAETDHDLQLEVPDEGFHVVDQSSANWIVRKILEARRHAERSKVFAAVEIRRAQRQEEFFVGRWGLELEEWARREIAKQFKRKSISLPAGLIGLRSVPERLDVRDETRVLAWCRANLPHAIKRSETLLKSPLLEYLRENGEVPPGVELIGGNEGFFIR